MKKSKKYIGIYQDLKVTIKTFPSTVWFFLTFIICLSFLVLFWGLPFPSIKPLIQLNMSTKLFFTFCFSIPLLFCLANFMVLIFYFISGKYLISITYGRKIDKNSNQAANLLNNNSHTDITCIGERLIHKKLSEGKWELYSYFSFFNNSNELASVYDMHSIIYSCMNTLQFTVPMMRGYAPRESIELLENNSILQHNKIYKISNNDSMSFSLIMDLFRGSDDKFVDEFTFSVFGIMADYHIGNLSYSTPTNCVYCFIHIPASHSITKDSRTEVFHVNSENINNYWEKFNYNLPWRMAMKIIDASLKEHLKPLKNNYAI